MIHFSNPPTIDELDKAEEIMSEACYAAAMLGETLGLSHGYEECTGTRYYSALYHPIEFWRKRIRQKIKELKGEEGAK